MLPPPVLGTLGESLAGVHFHAGHASLTAVDLTEVQGLVLEAQLQVEQSSRDHDMPDEEVICYLSI